MHGLHRPDATLTWFVVTFEVGLPIVVLVALLSEVADARTAPNGLGVAVRKLPRKPPSIAIIALAGALGALAAMTFSLRTASTARPRLIQVTFEGPARASPGRPSSPGSPCLSVNASLRCSLLRHQRARLDGKPTSAKCPGTPEHR